MTVIVKHLPEIGLPERPEEWWMADVIFVEGGARNPKVATLFQVADVDSEVVRWINADLVTHIVPRVVPVPTKRFLMVRNNCFILGNGGCVELGEVWGDLP